MTPWVFLDLETTGGSARDDRITEIGLIRLEDDVVVDTWSTLVNPGVPIPVEIQRLTGITPDMVREAPPFEAVAADLAQRIEGAVMVAHNARFDFGFLKAAFGRMGQTFSARTLCTVRLSRALHPQHARHNLDTLMERHRIRDVERHRAMGDAQAILALFRQWQGETEAATFDATLAKLLKRPSMPVHLDPDALTHLPERPGVYSFYGLNSLPLYIGKAINLKERIGAHFSNDYRSETDLRLSNELRRIEVEETAGELGALLLEARRVRERMPAYNIKLRRKTGWTALRFDEETLQPVYVGSPAVKLEELDQYYGLFSSRTSARAHLLRAVIEATLCARTLGLERGGGACFAYQLQQCQGACLGLESREDHHQRVLAALAPKRLLAWPWPGAIAIIERSADLLHEEWHVVDQWCQLGTVRTLDAALELEKATPRVFDLDAYGILRGYLSAVEAPVIPLYDTALTDANSDATVTADAVA